MGGKAGDGKTSSGVGDERIKADAAETAKRSDGRALACAWQGDGLLFEGN